LDINYLFKGARKGDSKAEEALFELLTARFRHFVAQRIWNQHDAEEVVQEALMTISKEYRNIEFECSFAAWVYKVLDNRILHYIELKKRRIGSMGRIVEDKKNPTVGSLTPDPELKRRLLVCLQKIATANIRYARILNFHYQGYGTDEICGKIDITKANFYSILSRARSLLEFCLDTGRIN
jgi:RNA polymerase sigma-70 factor (ECF subfamily)